MRWLSVLLFFWAFYAYSRLDWTGWVFWLLFAIAVWLFYKGGNKRRQAKLDEDSEAISAISASRNRLSSSSAKTTTHKRAINREIVEHARMAVRHAGRDPDETPVRLTDIGLLVYLDGDPFRYRMRDIPEQAQALQPFAIFHLQEKAYGPIRFDIYNDDDRLLYRLEEEHQLKPGRNILVTPTRLPIDEDLATQGRWCLQLHSEHHPIATHYFEWYHEAEFDLGADGEVKDFKQSEDPLEEEITLEDLQAGWNQS